MKQEAGYRQSVSSRDFPESPNSNLPFPLIAVNQGSGEHIPLRFHPLPGAGTGMRLGDLLHHPLL
jgi:hypothetical protein